MPQGVEQEIEQLGRELDDWIDLYSHPIRARIAELVRERGTATVAELAGEIDASPSTVQRSLRRLLDAGVLVKGRSRGSYEPADRRRRPARAS